jgi:hypothetical protein
MSTKNLNFSYNWNNKLDCKCFTTIRLSNAHEIGQRFNVYLNDKLRCHAVVVCKFSFSLEKLSDMLCYIDTGYSKEETIEVLRKMYKDVDVERASFTVYTLKKVE